MRKLIIAPGAIALALALTTPASASCFRASCFCPPPLPVEFRVVTRYRVVERVAFKEVAQVVPRRVPITIFKDVPEKVLVPVVRDVRRERTVLVPVTRVVPQQRVFYKVEFVPEPRERTILVPEIKVVERPYVVRLPSVRYEQYDRTVLVPDVRYVPRERAITVMKAVPTVVTHRVVTPVRVAAKVCDPCHGFVGVCGTIPVVRDVACTVWQHVPETVVQKWTEAVYFQRPVVEKVRVAVPFLREETRVARVPVTTWRPVVQRYTVQVPVRRRIVETINVPVTELKPKTEVFVVKVQELVPQVRVRKVAFHSFKVVPETVTVKVPYRVCVKVPYQVRVPVVCVPVGPGVVVPPVGGPGAGLPGRMPPAVR